MKKYLFLLAFLAVLSLTVLSAGHIWVNCARDKVDFTEIVLEGDPAAALDLAISYHVRDHYGNLLWDNSFHPGSPEQSETAFRFSASGESEEYPRDSYVDLECASANFSTSGGRLLDGDENPGLLMRPAVDVASRTSGNEERTEIVRLADYYEYYPMTFSARNRSDVMDFWVDSDTSENKRWLEAYFRLKVDENVKVEVTVSKSAGEVYDVRMHETEEPFLYSSFMSDGVTTENGVYLIAESYGPDGKPDSRLQCPDGPGVHRIPAREDTIQYAWCDLSRIQLFYPANGAQALRLTLSADETKLLLYTREADTLVLTVIDALTGDPLQRLELLEMGEDSYLRLVDQDMLHLVELDTTGEFCLIEEKGGVFRQALSGEFDLESEDQRFLTDGYTTGTSLAWDGTRLALAAASVYCCKYSFDYVIGVGVWDADGLLFRGAYDCGISRDPFMQTNTMQYMSSYSPPPVEFVKDS